MLGMTTVIQGKYVTVIRGKKEELIYLNRTNNETSKTRERLVKDQAGANAKCNNLSTSTKPPMLQTFLGQSHPT